MDTPDGPKFILGLTIDTKYSGSVFIPGNVVLNKYFIFFSNIHYSRSSYPDRQWHEGRVSDTLFIMQS